MDVVKGKEKKSKCCRRRKRVAHDRPWMVAGDEVVEWVILMRAGES
jgi:hypothetical protein